MKNKLQKILLIVILFVFVGSQVKGQKVVFGTIQYDIFKTVTKGAYWKSRPEAKLVYENDVLPPGIEVIVFQEDNFVRFAEKENNGLDRNYIIFPRGEKLYIKNGRVFAAICGNEVIFYQPVIQTRVVEPETKPLSSGLDQSKKEDEQSIRFRDNKSSSPEMDFEEQSMVAETNYEVEQTEKNGLKPWHQVVIGSALATASYFGGKAGWYKIKKPIPILVVPNPGNGTGIDPGGHGDGKKSLILPTITFCIPIPIR